MVGRTVGIGVDAVLVLCSSYTQAAQHQAATAMPASMGPAELLKMESELLAHTIQHALPIIAVATATTAVAFAAGLDSPLIPIRQFSLFQLLLVLANFSLLVIVL